MSIVHTLALELKSLSCFCWFKPAVKSVMLSFSVLTTEDMVGWLLVTQGSNWCHTKRFRASYTHLCSLTALLYIFPSSALETDPSAIIPASEKYLVARRLESVYR